MANIYEGCDGHEQIIRLIRSLNVESGQTLRQVQVPDSAYLIARSFLKWAPNVTVGPHNTSVACRFKVLYSISQRENIYTLLMLDAGATPLSDAIQKIDDWKDASKSLLRYALNLKLAPKRPEFQRMKLSSSYYVYQVAKKLQGAEKILLCMGYEQVSTSTNEIQELKYGGEVNTDKVVSTAADLVVLHSELERISDLVTGALQEKYRNMILHDILEARSEPGDTLDITLNRSRACMLERLKKQSPFGQVAQPALHRHHSQAPALPPRAYQQQRNIDIAHLPLPIAKGGRGSLQNQGDYQSDVLLGARRTSAPSFQVNASELRSRSPPPSPLLQHHSGQYNEQQLSTPPPNSKDQYNKMDKTIDKSQGKGIDSVGPKYFPDTENFAVSPAAKSGSIPFDTMNLPEPAFDTHDLEMFHQEVRSPEDSFAGSNMLSLLIDPRSMDYDFSGPDLDDHLTLRSHDSGHMALSGSVENQALGDVSKKCDSEQPPGLVEQDEETCISGIKLGYVNVHAPRIPDVSYEDVELYKKEEPPSSNVSFAIGGDQSADSPLQASSTDAQIECKTEQPSAPQPRPRSFSGGSKLSQPNDEQLSSISERPPLPRPRSNKNLLSTQHSQTPPSSPGRQKPVAKPRKVTPKVENSQEHNVTPQAGGEDISPECTSTFSIQSDKPQENLATIEEGLVTSHITSINSYSSMSLLETEQDSTQFEAHSSLESSSPNPSTEPLPSISNKSDPCPSTSPDNASSAKPCSGEKEFTEYSVSSSLGSWVSVEVKTKEQQHEPDVSSLDSQPRQRERALAFSSSGKLDKPVGDNTIASVGKASKTKDISLLEDSLMYSQVSAEIRNAKPCWYCTNLTKSRQCEICGNEQRKETTV